LSIRRFPIWIELNFWNLAILLLSESALLRGLVKWSYDNLTPRVRGIRAAQANLTWPVAIQYFNPSRVLLFAIAGWGLGFLIGIAGSVFLP
jgi:hypothetical protein